MAIVKQITASSRLSAKVNDIFYTFEYGQTVEIEPDDDLNEVKEITWKTCNAEVDRQLEALMPPKPTPKED